MRTRAAILYVAVMLGGVVLLNAGIDDALLIWSAASFCLGWITRYPWFAFLPLLAGPMAVPFGYADGSTDGDPLFLGAEVLLAAPIQGAIVMAGFGGRLLYDRFRASHT